MNQDRKLTVLESLLERVRLRALAPRVTAPIASTPPPSTPAPAFAAPPLTIAASAAAVEPAAIAPVDERHEVSAARPFAEALAPPMEHEGTFERPLSERPLSEPPSDLDEDEGPPSAPRLREGLGIEDEEEEEEETDQDFQDEDEPLKTPPPESGRQHVASPVPPIDSSDDLDVDISITVTEGEITPDPVPAMFESAPPESTRAPLPPSEPALDLGGPLPRLAFVSEPEIELHVRPRAPVFTPAPASQPSPEISTGTSRPPAPPDETSRIAASAPPAPLASEPPTGKRPIVESDVRPVSAPSSAPAPVRLMAQPTAESATSGGPPVEVWASTHAPAGLRGQVATFVGQNASFTPQSFGDLLDASLALGES